MLEVKGYMEGHMIDLLQKIIVEKKITLVKI